MIGQLFGWEDTSFPLNESPEEKLVGRRMGGETARSMNRKGEKKGEMREKILSFLRTAPSV